MMETINRTLFLLLNAGDHPSVAGVWLAKLLAQQSILLLPVLLFGLWGWGGRTGRSAALMAVLCVLLALVSNVLIGLCSMHPRPFMIPLGHSWISHKAETSFPSDHATIFFAFGLGLLVRGVRRLGVVIALLGVAVGWSRVYLGVHFPFDIIGALLVAIATTWALVVALGIGNLGDRLMVRLEGLHRTVFAGPISKGWMRN